MNPCDDNPDVYFGDTVVLRNGDNATGTVIRTARGGFSAQVKWADGAVGWVQRVQVVVVARADMESRAAHPAAVMRDALAEVDRRGGGV